MNGNTLRAKTLEKQKGDLLCLESEKTTPETAPGYACYKLTAENEEAAAQYKKLRTPALFVRYPGEWIPSKGVGIVQRSTGRGFCRQIILGQESRIFCYEPMAEK